MKNGIPATTGKLRSMLMSAMERLMAGDMKIDQAQAIVKVAAQINTSLIAEAQIARINFLSNRNMEDIGQLQIENEPFQPRETIEQKKQ